MNQEITGNSQEPAKEPAQPEDTRSYLTIMEGVGVYTVALMVWNHNEQDYSMAQSEGPFKKKSTAVERADRWARERDLEIR